MVARDKVSVHYTRCPVPTATAIGIEKGFFDVLYADTLYQLRDIEELGCESANAHYTHALDYLFREGGGAPPVWARAGGADSQLLGLTFMEELLGIFVRARDSAETVADLAGRRIGLPVWPALVFDFWRFAAHKGFVSALSRHGLRCADVEFVDIVESAGPNGNRGRRNADAGASGLFYGYRAQLEALLANRIDAIFGKGAEAALLEREANGRIRLLYDIRSSPEISDRVNNSTPRLITAGARLVADHPEAAIRYLQGILRAARWALRHPEETGNIVAIDCGIGPADLERYFQPDYATRLMPAASPELLATLEVMKSFLFEKGYLARDFSVEQWLNADLLKEAQTREGSEQGVEDAFAMR